MTDGQSNGESHVANIALVGTTRAGKSVFTAALAKYLEKKRDGVWLSPKGGSPKNTYAQVDEWWNALQTGNWLPATPPGTIIELQWNLRVHDKSIPLRMFDYAGENLTDLFSGRKDDATGAAKDFFEKVRENFESASILLVLINLESFIERDVFSAGENKGILVSAMSSFLDKVKQEGRSCRVCFVFTAFDQYQSVILEKWGSIKNFLEQEIPPLFNEYVDRNSNVGVLAVAAVRDTEARVDPFDGKTIRYPKPGFRTAGFKSLVNWLIEAINETSEDLNPRVTEADLDDQNVKFIEQLAIEWSKVSDATERGPLNNFLRLGEQFPFPYRPNAAQLEPQRLAYINKAKSLRNSLVKQDGSGAVKEWGGGALVLFIVLLGSGVFRGCRESSVEPPEKAAQSEYAPAEVEQLEGQMQKIIRLILER